jgi:hypothetical protein
LIKFLILNNLIIFELLKSKKKSKTMKKFTLVAFTLLGSLAFMGCSGDDDSGGGCFTCSATGQAMKYCKKGSNQFTVEVGGIVIQTGNLGDQTWEEFKADMLELCD